MTCRSRSYCAVSVNVATGCPTPYGPSAVTVTLCALAGNVNVADATPKLLVTATTLTPLFVPFETDPADAVNNTLAPFFAPPDDPGFNVTVNAVGSAVPFDPVCPSPAVLVSVAAGFPTTIQPPCACVTPALSVPLTEKWQNPGELPALTTITPFVDVVTAAVVMFNDPEHIEAPS